MVVGYYHAAYRVRGWGTFPSRPGPKLLVANHQHEIESSVIISDVNVRSRIWRHPIFTVSSRRMWEPGFFAERIPWLSPFLRTANTGWLFSSLGMQPIENELHFRPFVSIAYVLLERHGDLPIDRVFASSALERLGPGVRTLRDLLSPKHFAVSRSRVKLTEVTEEFRKELLEFTRAQVETDLAHFENLQRNGATIFLTPEGNYSGDGKMQRFRGALARLAPLAEIWLAAISYDPFVAPRRLSMLYRILPASKDLPLEIQLKRGRPLTVSALLAHWLFPRGNAAFTLDEAQDAVKKSLAELSARLFVDPELQHAPEIMVERALMGMRSLGVVEKTDGAFRLRDLRRHPQFPRTSDIVAYQYNFHQETLEGIRYAS